MKLWIVSRMQSQGYEAEDQPVFLAACATPLDALGAVEADGGSVVETRGLAARYVIGADERSWYDFTDVPGGVGGDFIRLEVELKKWNRPLDTYWHTTDTWHVREVELVGMDRAAMFAALHADAAQRGYEVPLPDYDHVHRVEADVQGTGT